MLGTGEQTMEHKCKKADVKPIEKCELNKEQIIKALDYCSSGGNCMNCPEDKNNPRLSKTGCMAVQMRNALSLINELTEEVEGLKQCVEHEHASFMETFGEWNDKCAKLAEENERLRAELAERPQKLIITKLPKKRRARDDG